MSQPLASGGARAARKEGQRPFAHVVSDYVAITKPKHQFVLLTCWAAMAISSVRPGPGFVLYVLFATSLAVASSHIFNQVLDADIDAVMRRTRSRPLAAGRISVTGAVAVGSLLGALSIALMLWRVNLLSALLVVAGLVVYVPIYTYWLKRKSPWCTLIGGISGAIPTLIGNAAATGRIELGPFLLFLFMVVWQCPHFFALSLFRSEDYRAAKVPMLVVVEGVEATLRQMAAYTVIMVACTLLLYTTGAAGPAYLTAVSVCGGLYLAGVIAANVQGKAAAPAWGKRLFFSSYLYLAVVFVSAVADRAA